MGFNDRLQHAWNAFKNNKDPTDFGWQFNAGYSTYRPDRPRLSRGNERSIINSIFNRIALDVEQIEILHVKLDKDGRYIDTINSGLNNCLTLEANIDQTARSFRRDAVISMFDEGVVALVPIETDDDPEWGTPGSFDINTMRTGKVLEWAPTSVKLEAYNEFSGKKENLVMEKQAVALIENPLYTVINEQNSTLKRLVRKLNILDAIDEQSGSGKMDLIIQLPYTVRSDKRKEQAAERRKNIEDQLTNSKYGIAYLDGTEHITQLNRPVENNLLKQIEYLTSMLYSQLGITTAIMDGSANEKEMLNYYNRTVEPIVSAFVDEIKRKFLTKTARTQGQSIMYFRDPFKLVPVTELAEISDKLIRNEVATSNEVRSIIGWKPAKDPKADQLLNPNIKRTDQETKEIPNTVNEEEIQNG